MHQLVSSQLDMDRLDYLNRDSFFTGVSEGVISSDRIIKMLEVVNDELVIEAKGIYSIEKFIVSRRLMYWQVYLHKTVVSAESLLINILKRAKELVKHKDDLFATPALKLFLLNNFSKKDFLNDEKLLDRFSELDDSDITTSVKIWSQHPDPILSSLCGRMVNRRLFKIILQREPFEEKFMNNLKEKIMAMFKIKENELNYFLLSGKLVNNAYNTEFDKIKILFKDGTVKDISEAADTLNIKVLSEPVEKYYISYPKI